MGWRGREGAGGAWAVHAGARCSAARGAVNRAPRPKAPDTPPLTMRQAGDPADAAPPPTPAVPFAASFAEPPPSFSRSPPSYDGVPDTHAREAALWERQERLWERELARWDAERVAWDAREAALMGAIGALQGELARVAGLLPGGVGVAGGAAQLAPAPPQAAPATARNDGGYEAAQVAAAAPPAAPAPAPAPPPTFADHLAAAVAAAERGDAEADETGGHRELLARAAGAAAAPSPPPPSTARPPWSATPPTLVQGSDDIFWVNALQNGLDAQALHCGDEEAEDFFFGPQTHSALLTFQAMARLPETGVVDYATWQALLGDALDEMRPPGESELAAAGEVAAAAVAPSPPPPPPQSMTVETFSSHSITVEDAPGGGVRVTETDIESVEVSASAPPSSQPPRTSWPLVREGDGGRFVHELQVALNGKGFHCGEEDEEWWQFGDPTHAALVTFQACAGLPESGVSCESTWKALLGEHATPADGAALSAGDGTDDDMLGGHHVGAVYLVGEQRWSTPGEMGRRAVGGS